jgi:hypothetical protein
VLAAAAAATKATAVGQAGEVTVAHSRLKLMNAQKVRWLKEVLVGMAQGMAGVPISTSMHRQYIIHRRYQTTMIVQGMPRHVVSQSHNVLNIGVKLLHHHIHAAWAKQGPTSRQCQAGGQGRGSLGAGYGQRMHLAPQSGSGACSKHIESAEAAVHARCCVPHLPTGGSPPLHTRGLLPFLTGGTYHEP